MTEVDPDLVAAEVLRAFGKTRYAPSPAGSFTILAAFILHNTSTQTYKVISLATGSKCLPLTALSPQGISIHDSHAEILARRGVLRWILLQLARQQPSYDCFEQLNQPPSADDPNDFTAVHNLWSLKRNLNFILYISTPPCGDASMTLLASAQEPEMRLLKDSNLAESSESALSDSPESAITLVRGRNNYGLRSALRTKPGRQDSPVTYSMSCSDKIARWNTIGIQGALLSRLVEPLFIADIVIGNIPQELHAAVAIDCDRAFWGRLQSRLPVHKPRLHFTTLKFPFSGPAAVSSNEALCWVEGCNRSPEVTVKGLRRGVSLKNRYLPSCMPMLCKQSLFQLWHDVTLSQARYYDEVTSQDNEMKPGSDSGLKTYHEEKLLSIDYNESKRRLCGPGCPFQEWLTTGKQWESFSI